MEAIDQIKSDEAFRAHGYFCSQGVLTVGYGRNIDKNAGGPGISEAEAAILLCNDLGDVEKDLRRIFPNWDRYDNVRQGALLNMRFQLGPNRLRKFRRMIAAVKHGDWTQACLEARDSRWAKQTPARAHRVSQELLDGVVL